MMEVFEKEELFKKHFVDEVIDDLYHSIIEAIYNSYENKDEHYLNCMGTIFFKGIQHIDFLSGEFGKFYCVLKQYDKHLNPYWDEDRDWGELYYKTYTCQYTKEPFKEVINIKFYNEDEETEPDFEYELSVPGYDLLCDDEYYITLGTINHNVGQWSWVDVEYLKNNHLFHSKEEYKMVCDKRKQKKEKMIDFEKELLEKEYQKRFNSMTNK